MNKNDTEFERILVEAIDEAFMQLGEQVKKAIYDQFERRFQLLKEQIPSRIDDFSDALEKIFGTATRYVEILIMKKLHEKVGCDFRWNGPCWLVPNLTFREYVELLRIDFENKSEIAQVEVWVDAEEKSEKRV